MFKRFVVCCLAMLWLSFSIQAIDWGGSSTFFATVESDDDLDWFSEGLLALWLSAALGPSYSIVSQGSFRATTEPLCVADLDLLYVEGLSAVGEGMAVGIRAGRFILDEFSGLVFEHRGDGAELWLSSRPAITRIGAVYTGLLVKPNSAVVMSKLDEIDDRDDDVRLAPWRLVAIGELQFVEPVPRTDVTLALVVQQDLRDSSDLIEEGETILDETSGGLLDTRHALLGVNGALGTRWFYELTGGVQFGRVLAYVRDAESGTGARYAYADIRSYVAAIGLEHYLAGPHAGRLALGALYSSGDPDSRSVREGGRTEQVTQFQSIATQPIGLVAAAQPGNLVTAGVDFGLRPFTVTAPSTLSELQTAVSATMLLRALDSGPVDMAGVNVERGGRYLGTELGASIVYRPYYDLGMSLQAGVLLPNSSSSGPLDDDWHDPRFMVQAEMSLSF